MKLVPLPDYAADEFLSLRKHPSNKEGAYDQSLKRKYRLIADALDQFENKQWRIDDAPEYRLAILDEFYGLERFEHGFCVYGSERGIRGMLAIFESVHLAANYFVWIVSKGQRTIDWTKFMEMEP
jgi:hypothetical protein